jgi:hypothetical protein
MRKITQILFYSFPLSFILGNLIVSGQLLLFIIASLILIYKEKLNIRFKNTYWILILFFLSLIIVTAVHYESINALKLKLYQSPGLLNEDPNVAAFKDNSIFKSFLQFRFLILIFVVDTLFYNKILNLKKFFLFCLCCTSFVSLDVIMQYFVGFDLFGLKSMGNRNSGPFGDEVIAGGYLQRFSFVSLFSALTIFNEKKFKKPLLILIIIIHAVAVLFAGNKMPLLLFLFGSFLTIIFIKEIRSSMIAGMIGFLIVFFLTIKNDTHMYNVYKNFYGNASNIFTKRVEIKLENEIEEADSGKTEINKNKKTGKSERSILRGSGHYYIFHNSILVWKDQPYFGSGLKSFRVKCWENLTEKSMSLFVKNKNKKYLACSNHPHNYYLELLAETGVFGFGLILIFFTIIMKDSFIYLIKKNKESNMETLLLAPIIISVLLEIWPLKSTGSFFSTWNATFFWLFISMLLAIETKKLVK